MKKKEYTSPKIAITICKTLGKFCKAYTSDPFKGDPGDVGAKGSMDDADGRPEKNRYDVWEMSDDNSSKYNVWE